MTHDQWMHLDIAGVMSTAGEIPYLRKGMAGETSSPLSLVPSVRPSVCIISLWRRPVRSPSVRPSVRPSVYIIWRHPVRPSVRPSVYIIWRHPVRPSVRPSVYIIWRHPVRPSVRPSVRPCTLYGVTLSVCSSVHHPSWRHPVCRRPPHQDGCRLPAGDESVDLSPVSTKRQASLHRSRHQQANTDPGTRRSRHRHRSSHRHRSRHQHTSRHLHRSRHKHTHPGTNIDPCTNTHIQAPRH